MALAKLPEGGDKVITTLAERWKQEGMEEILQKKDEWVNEAKSEGKLENSLEMLAAAFQNRLELVNLD